MKLKSFLKTYFPFLKPLVKVYRWAKSLPRKFLIKSKKKSEIKTLVAIMSAKTKKDFTFALKRGIAKRLKEAYDSVPYWQRFEQLAKANEDNAFEILHSLPLLSKDIILKNGSDMWKVGRNPSNTGSGHTGGTTGKPLEFLYGYVAEDTHQPALYEYMSGIKYFGHLDGYGKIVCFDGGRPCNDDVENNIYWTDRPGRGGYMAQ